MAIDPRHRYRIIAWNKIPHRYKKDERLSLNPDCCLDECYAPPNDEGLAHAVTNAWVGDSDFKGELKPFYKGNIGSPNVWMLPKSIMVNTFEEKLSWL